VARFHGFVDIAYVLPRILARIIILDVKNLKCVCANFAVSCPSLKSAASEIVFGLCNKQQLHFDKVTTCKPVEIPDFVDIIRVKYVGSRLIQALKILQCGTANCNGLR